MGCSQGMLCSPFLQLFLLAVIFPWAVWGAW